MSNLALRLTLRGVPIAVYVIEFVIVLALVAWWSSRPSKSRRRAVANPIKNDALAIAIVVSTALILGVSISLIRWPRPLTHDEFAYLLAADTFSQGRLTNDPHPLWESFQSYHILCRPTYQGKYPPGQGVALAMGQRMFGFPLAGVWFSFAFACGATTWMLRSQFSTGWSLTGGLLTATNPALLFLWTQSYWGGAVAMLGGALLFGSLARMLRRPTVAISLTMGVGLAILANTRPFEGLLASLPVALVLAVWSMSKRVSWWNCFLPRVVLPVASLLMLCSIGMAAYNHRVTGDWLKMPYMEWADQNRYKLDLPLWKYKADGEGRVFNFAAGSPEHVKLPKTDWTVGEQRRMKTAAAFSKVANFILCFGGITFLAVIILLPKIYRTWEGALAFLTSAIVITAVICTPTTGHTHYAAPVVPLIIFLCLQACRFFVTSDNPILVGTAYALIAAACLGAPIFMVGYSLVDNSPHEWADERDSVVAKLQSEDGDHLVIAFFSADSRWQRERVYNLANIDRQKVVWARDLGEDRNRKLVAYFSDRRIWLLKVTAETYSLQEVRSGPFTSQ